MADLWKVFCEETVRKWPNEEAIVVWDKKDRKSITYSELKATAAQISNGLIGMGLKKGERCMLLAQTNILWAKLALAVARTGALLVPVDPSLSREEIQYILREVQPKIALVESDLEDKIDEALVGRIITLGGSARHFTLNNLLFQPIEAIVPPKLNEQDPLVIPYTSGTTGDPKGSVLTHQGFLEVTCPAAIERLNLTQDEVIVSVGSFHHIMGFFVLQTILTLGAKLVYTNDYRRILDILREEKATVFLAIPKLLCTMYERIIEGIKAKGLLSRILLKIAPRIVGQKLKKILGLENLRFIVSGSAPMDPEVIKGFRRLGIGFVEGYGMSENSSLSHASTPFNNKPGSVGPLISGMEQKIMRVLPGPETGRLVTVKEEARPGEYGELWLRGPNVMQGYLERPDLTAEVLDKDGWLHTGDWGVLDLDDWLWLKGRLDEVMVTPGGKNIAKPEVETVLLRSPFVEEVVVDLADNKLQAKIYPVLERICGRSLSKEEAEEYSRLNSQEIIEHLWKDLEKRQQQELAPFKRVSKSGIQIVAEPFEKTGTQKIKRHLVPGSLTKRR